MLAYWAMFGFFALGAMVQNGRVRSRDVSALFYVGLALVFILVGLRFEVGGDWKSYAYLFRYTRTIGLERTLDASDVGYQLLNWLVAALGGSVVGVNVICAAIFCWGLNRFARQQPDPWLTMLVAVPYLIVVVAMGYTRQATAIGVLLAGLAALSNGASLLRFAVYVAVAALFHKTAVVMLPFAVFAVQRNRVINLIVGAVASYLLYRYFLADALETFVKHYLDAEYGSQGALIRVMMSFLPALLFFATSRRLGFEERERRLWWIFAATSVLALALLFVVRSSTAIDRLALYLIPLQLAVVPRLTFLISDRRIATLMVAGYAGAVLLVWLMFAANAAAWLPYKFALLS